MNTALSLSILKRITWPAHPILCLLLARELVFSFHQTDEDELAEIEG